MIPALSFTIKNTGNIDRILRDFDRNAAKALARAMHIEAESVLQKADKLVPVDMGALRNSAFVQPAVMNGKTVLVTLGYGGAAAPYALAVHEGTKPRGMTGSKRPPIEPLKEWAERHGVSREESEGVAWAISTKIYNEGTKPTKFLEIPFNQAKKGMAGRIYQHLKADMLRGV